MPALVTDQLCDIKLECLVTLIPILLNNEVLVASVRALFQLVVLLTVVMKLHKSYDGHSREGEGLEVFSCCLNILS